MLNIENFLNTLDIARVQALLLSEESKHEKAFESLDFDLNSNKTFNCANPIRENGVDMLLFYFEDILPTYKGTDRNKEYGMNLLRYYTLSVNRQVTIYSETFPDDKLVIFIEQRFKENYKRDLDNRNRKLLVDSLKANRIIKDDTFENISIYEKGLGKQERNETIVYIIEEKNVVEFLELKTHNRLFEVEKELVRRRIELQNFNEGKV